MGYQALLFCPDEKTARTVTQVLSELEFNVESCIEPFAAVKKLMGQHFDAVVVDCDNEQNATLLFKSARNSASNQASLAVAVVEGQAGVAKAFRIGANLVLTKPINIEQAKGTLRVARGLLRKGEPAKPVAPAAAAPLPATPVAAKPLAPAKAGSPPATAAVSAPRPVQRPAPRPAAVRVAQPAPTPAWPAPAKVAAASSIPAARDEDVLEISAADSATEVSASAPIVPTLTEVKTAFSAGSAAGLGSGAASAPAPAREPHHSRIAEVSPRKTAALADDLFEKPVEAARTESPSIVGSAPSFTFGGANEPAESSDGSKRILLGVAAAAIVAAGLYAGWSHFQGRRSEPTTTRAPAPAAPVATPQIPKPSGAQLSNSSAPPTTSASLPSSPPTAAAPAKTQPVANPDAVPEARELSSAPSSASTTASKTSAASKADVAPLVVQGGTAPAVQPPPPVAPDAPAPSIIGIATTGSSAPPPNLVGGEGSAPTPVLQSLNISQGVSQGLLLKKVQPLYPRTALTMRIEGSVELLATIAKSGEISQVKVLRGDSQLTRAATDAVKQWKYKPYLLNGQPVEIQTQVTINFKLPK
jgi:protein TonB